MRAAPFTRFALFRGTAGGTNPFHQPLPRRDGSPPGHRGIDLLPTSGCTGDEAHSLDTTVDDACLLDDVMIAQETRLGHGGILVTGRLRQRGKERPLRLNLPQLARVVASRTRQVGRDGIWGREGSRGRT